MEDMKLNVAIVGASGYSGEELIRLLANHPKINLSQVTSRSHAGKPIVDVITRCRGYVPNDFCFTPSNAQELANNSELDLVFLALPHGVASEFAIPIHKAGTCIIDLSADYRLDTSERYEEFYGHPHPAPDLLKEAAYVIPELAQGDWRKQRILAAPGCYPTSIIIPLYPLLKNGLIEAEGIIAHSMSGISGGGKKAVETYLYCERAESIKAYGIPKHRHLSEIEEQLSIAAGKDIVIQFTPHLAPMRRGLASSIVVKPKKPGSDAIYKCWQDAYGDKPFVDILTSGQTPNTADVVRSNRIEISAAYDERTKNLIITSAEDNLLKGASGQAVQIMNLWIGFNETLGL